MAANREEMPEEAFDEARRGFRDRRDAGGIAGYQVPPLEDFPRGLRAPINENAALLGLVRHVFGAAALSGEDRPAVATAVDLDGNLVYNNFIAACRSCQAARPEIQDGTLQYIVFPDLPEPLDVSGGWGLGYNC